MIRSISIIALTLVIIIFIIGVGAFISSRPDPPRKPNIVTNKYFTSRNNYPLICQYEATNIYGYTEDSCDKYDVGDTLKTFK